MKDNTKKNITENSSLAPDDARAESASSDPNGASAVPGKAPASAAETRAAPGFDPSKLAANDAGAESVSPDPDSASAIPGNDATSGAKMLAAPEFDLSKFRLPQDFAARTPVKKLLTTVRITKPSKQQFVRVHAAEDWRAQTMLIQLKDENEWYLVSNHLWADLEHEAVPFVLFAAMARPDVLFVWPVKIPAADGRRDEWNASALQAAQIAMKRWVRVSANMSLGAYDIFQASGQLSEPEWPEITFKEILRLAFRDRIVDSLEHPVLRKLRGEL